MELKTLKDIENSYGRHIQNMVYVTDLKKEAIKWIKEDNRKRCCEEEYFYIRKWMKRLNITEEDLE